MNGRIHSAEGLHRRIRSTLTAQLLLAGVCAMGYSLFMLSAGIVVTVCDASSGEPRPYFPASAKQIHWSFADPASVVGSYAEQSERTMRVRDEIMERIQS